MNKMDLLNRYSKISIVSLLNLGNTISATDLGAYTRLGSNVFTFEENGENYSFMVLDFKVNGKEYLLSDNKKLKNLILSNLPKEEIETIKKEIIASSKLDKDKDFKKKYKKLIDRVEVVQLYSAQAGNGSVKYVIKDKGSYYSCYDSFLKKKYKVYLNSWTHTPIWKEDSFSANTIYVINSLKINKEEINDQLKLYCAVDDSEGLRIDSNLYSWCGDRNFESFGQLSTDMDFKKLILSDYKSDYGSQNVYEAEKLGYLSKTLKYYVNKFKGQLQAFIDNNTEYELFVELIKQEGFNHPKENYVYIKVKPNMTYGELFRAIIKKCREIEKLSDDSELIRDEYMWINDTKYKGFNDFEALLNNNNTIKLDIKDLKFVYWIDDFTDPNEAEHVFWKELNVPCKDEKIEPVEEKPVEKQEQEEKEEEKQVEEKPVEVQEQNVIQNKKQEEKEENKQKNGECCTF